MMVMKSDKNSKEDLERALMLLDLEPAAIFSPMEVQDSPYYSNSDKQFKMNFDDYIDKFEQEFEPVNLYKANQPMKLRLKDIRTTLVKYNEESIARNKKGKADEAVFRQDVEGDSKNEALVQGLQRKGF